MPKLRAAVIGVGYLGNFHVQKYLADERVELVGVVDTDPARAAEIAEKYGVPAHRNYRELFGAVDLVSIVTPPATHFEVASECLRADIHVLVEKPVTESVSQAEELIGLAASHGRILQVGHLERFNPAVAAVRAKLDRPYLIEAQRFAPYKARGTEVDVVLDLMIHDLDIVLSLLECPIESVRASGTAVVSGDIDIAHAHLKFANGCAVDLAASRVSEAQVRTMSIHQTDAYVSIDYSSHSMLYGVMDGSGGRDEQRVVSFEQQDFARADVLMEEIRSFIDAVSLGRRPTVTGEDGKRALELAIDISQRIHRFRDERSSTSGLMY